MTPEIHNKLEILICCIESISMKVSALIKYIMKIMCGDLKKNSFESFQTYTKRR